MLEFSLETLGDCAVIVRLPGGISQLICRQIRQLDSVISNAKVPGVVETVPAYSTLAIYYEPWIITYDDLCRRISSLARSAVEAESVSARTFELPICYDQEFAPDIFDVAAQSGLTADSVAALHASAVYTVAMIGFTPGFPYLFGLPPQIATPRLPIPRERVAGGSVGIGGAQTGIYPRESPGGWKIIGRTPYILFDSRQERPSLLEPGDTVKFVKISKDEFDELGIDQKLKVQ